MFILHLTNIKLVQLAWTGPPAHLPHSQCSLRENLKFFANFRAKNNKLRNFYQNSGLIYDMVVQAWHSKVKKQLYFS
jgi:hypothetical protein